MAKYRRKLVEDLFNRGDETLNGAAWDTYDTYGMKIISQEVGYDSAASAGSLYNGFGTSSTRGQWCEFKLSTVPGTSENISAAILMTSSAGDYYRFDISSDKVGLYDESASAWDIDGNPLNHSHTATTDEVFRIESHNYDDTIKCYIDNELEISATNNNIATGYTGIYYNSGGATVARIDDFKSGLSYYYSEDDFERINENLSSGNWSTFGTPVQLTNNKAAADSTNGARRSLYDEDGVDDLGQWAEVKVSEIIHASDDCGPCIFLDSNDYFYQAEINPDKIQIWRSYSGTNGYIGSAWNGNVQLGDIVRIESWEDDGEDNLRVYLNGAEIIKTLDTELTSGKPGISFWKTSGTSTGTLDNFKCGSAHFYYPLPAPSGNNIAQGDTSITGTNLEYVIQVTLYIVGKDPYPLSISNITDTSITIDAFNIFDTSFLISDTAYLFPSNGFAHINFNDVTLNYPTGMSAQVLTTPAIGGAAYGVPGASAGDTLVYSDTVDGNTVTMSADSTYTLSLIDNATDTWYLYDADGTETWTPIEMSWVGSGETAQFSDDFNRDDSELNSTPWNTFESYPLQVKSNVCGGDVTGGGRGSYVNTVSGRGQWAEVKVTTLPAVGENLSPNIFMDPATGYRYEATITRDYIRIWGDLASGTGWISVEYAHTLVVGEVIRIESYSANSNIKVFLDDAEITAFTTTDSTLTDGYPGIHSWQPATSAGRVDDFKCGTESDPTTMAISSINGGFGIIINNNVTRVDGTGLVNVDTVTITQSGKTDVVLSATSTDTLAIAETKDFFTTELDLSKHVTVEVSYLSESASISGIAIFDAVAPNHVDLTSKSSTGAVKDIIAAVTTDDRLFFKEQITDTSTISVGVDGDFIITPAVPQGTTATWQFYDDSASTYTAINSTINQVGERTILYTDDFNRTNGALTDPWVDFYYGKGATIIGNEVGSTVVNDARGSYLPEIAGRPQWAEVTVTTLPAAGDNTSPNILMQASTGYRYEATIKNDYVRIWGSTPAGSGWLSEEYTHTLAVGEIIRIESFSDNSNIKVFINDQLVITIQHSELVAGSPGINIWQTNATPVTRIDDFRAGIQTQDFVYVPVENEVWSDDFNRTDGPLTSPWVTIAPQAPVLITNNELRASVNDLPRIAYYPEVFGRGQWAEIEISSPPISENTFVGVNILFNPETWYRYSAAVSSNKLILMAASNVSPGGRALSSDYSIQAKAGDKIRLESYPNSDTIKVFYNDVETIVVSNGEVTTGYPAIDMYQGDVGTNAALDNFKTGTSTLEWDVININSNNVIINNAPISIYGTNLDLVYEVFLYQPGQPKIRLNISSRTNTRVICTAINIYNTSLNINLPVSVEVYDSDLGTVQPPVIIPVEPVIDPPIVIEPEPEPEPEPPPENPDPIPEGETIINNLKWYWDMTGLSSGASVVGTSGTYHTKGVVESIGGYTCVREDLTTGETWPVGWHKAVYGLPPACETWQRVWVYHPSGFDFSTNDTERKTMRLETKLDNDGSRIGTINVMVGNVLTDEGRADGSWTSASTVSYTGPDRGWWDLDKTDANAPKEGAWQCWEMYVKIRPDTTGEWRFWIDGKQVGPTINCRTNATDSSGRAQNFMYISNWNGGCPKNQSHYWRDAAIAVRHSGRDDTAHMDRDENGFPYIGTALL